MFLNKSIEHFIKKKHLNFIPKLCQFTAALQVNSHRVRVSTRTYWQSQWPHYWPDLDLQWFLFSFFFFKMILWSCLPLLDSDRAERQDRQTGWHAVKRLGQIWTSATAAEPPPWATGPPCSHFQPTTIKLMEKKKNVYQCCTYNIFWKYEPVNESNFASLLLQMKLIASKSRHNVAVVMDDWIF